MSHKIPLARYIELALDRRLHALYCPGCDQRLPKAASVGALADWANDAVDPAIGSNRLFALCQNCANDVAKPAFFAQVEPRLRRDPEKFTLPVLSPEEYAQMPDGCRIAPMGNYQRDPWVANDSEWFARNPNRNYRLRVPLPGELGSAGLKDLSGAYLVLVCQSESPVRQRQLALNPGLPPDEIEHLNASEKRILRLLQSHKNTAGED